jgi:hypothetical protein
LGEIILFRTKYINQVVEEKEYKKNEVNKDPGIEDNRRKKLNGE